MATAKAAALADVDDTQDAQPKAALKKKVGKKRGRAKKAKPSPQTQRVQVSADQLPRKSLEQSLRVARALRDVLAGGPAKWPDIASAMGISQGSQTNKYFLWSAQAYGLIEKNDDEYSLSEIGRKILAPTSPGEDKEAQVRALLSPVVFSRFFTDYNGSPFPSDEHIGNVLEVRYGVPRDRIEEAKALLKENGLYAGILRATDTGFTVHLDPASTGLPSPTEQVSPTVAAGDDSEDKTDKFNFDQMCFVLTPIGEDDSEQRRHANMILKHVIEPVTEELAGCGKTEYFDEFPAG